MISVIEFVMVISFIDFVVMIVIAQWGLHVA